MGHTRGIRARATSTEPPRASLLLVMAIYAHLDTGIEALRVINNYQTYVILSAIYRSVPLRGADSVNGGCGNYDAWRFYRLSRGDMPPELPLLKNKLEQIKNWADVFGKRGFRRSSRRMASESASV